MTKKVIFGYWNERVIKQSFPNEDYYAVHEVYYGEDDKPHSCTNEATAPCGETLEELENCVRRYLLACTLPVLRYEDFTNQEANRETRVTDWRAYAKKLEKAILECEHDGGCRAMKIIETVRK